MRRGLHQLKLWPIAAYGLILAGFLLRVHLLNDVAVEKSEFTNIVWFIRDGLEAVLTHNKALNNHPLNSVLGYFMSLGNESLFTFRWHSVVIGVITVAGVLRLARDWFGRRDGLITGLLISLSAYHVTLSQRARGYVGLVGFTVLGFFLARRALETGRKRYWFGFVAVSVLNIYAHLYGAMAVGVISLIIVGLILHQQRFPALSRPSKSAQLSAPAAAGRTQPAQQTPPRPPWSRRFRPLGPLIASVAAIYLISFALYAPMLADTVSVAGQSNIFRESDLRHLDETDLVANLEQPLASTIRPFSMAKDETRLRLGDPTIHYGPFDRLALPAETGFGYYLALVSFGLGVLFSWRKYRQATLICLVWLLLPFLVQGVGYLILPGAYFRPRFLGFVYPPYLFLMARGWPGLADWLAARSDVWPGLNRLAAGVLWLGVGLLVALNLAWLGAFYSAARNEHWEDVAQFLKQNSQSNDLIYCGQRADTACTFDLSVRLRREVKELDEEFITFEEIQARRAYFEQPGRVWVVLPHLTARQVTALGERFEPTHYRLWGDANYAYVGWLLVDSQPALADNLAAALRAVAEMSLNAEEQYKNYTNLAKIYLARDQLAAAEEAFDVARRLLPDEADSWQAAQLAPIAEQLEYARQTAGVSEQLPASAILSQRNFSGLARLVAYELDRSHLSPGDTLRVTLYWQPLAPIERDLVSFVHLTDLTANVLSEAQGIPAGGSAPTTTWQPGQLIVDTYTLPIDPATPAPLATRLEAGLFDPANYAFIKAIGPTGQDLGSALTDLKIVPARAAAPEPAVRLEASFAGLISLIGYDRVAEPPGFVFYWTAVQPIETDYTVFIHVLDGSGQLVGQMDGPPLSGNYPTSWWSPGETIVDQRLGLEVAPGDYEVLVGWYDAASGARLPLAGGSGDSLSLGTVTIP